MRAVTQIVADTRSLFLLRGYNHLGLKTSPAAGKALEQLCRSDNAAIANEALRLRGADRAINHDEVL